MNGADGNTLALHATTASQSALSHVDPTQADRRSTTGVAIGSPPIHGSETAPNFGSATRTQRSWPLVLAVAGGCS